MKKITRYLVPSAKVECLSSHKSTFINGLTLMILTFFLLGISLNSSAQCLLYEDEQIFPDYGGVEFNGEVYYVAYQRSPLIGGELWKTDVTPEGTKLLKDINTNSHSQTSNPVSMTVFDGALFFFADDGIHGHELWKTDGSEAGTELVIDLNVGTTNSNAVYVDDSYPDDPYPYLNVLNGELLLFADDGISGPELWKTDGTAAGTVQVKDIIPGPTGSRPEYLATYNGEVYFTIYDGSDSDLWKTNGTAAGTILVKEDITTSRYILNDNFATVEYNGELYFAARDQIYNSSLWKTDGSTLGTEIVKDIYPNSFNDRIAYLTLFDGKIFFSADDGVNGDELWSSDGTSNGTQLVANIASGAEPSYPRNLLVLNNELLFTARNGTGNASTGYELWKSDGTPGGTVLVKDIFPGTGIYGVNSSGPRDFVILNGELIFLATSDNGFLWKTDGTENGTVAIMDIAPGYTVGNRPFFGLDRIFFSVRDGTDYPIVQSLYAFSNIDSDHDGIDDACDDMFSVCDALDFLDTEVTALNLPNNTEGFLLDKLAQATTKFQQGNTNAANGKLGAFINKVNAKSPSQISASQAAALIALADLIIDEMTNGTTDCSSGGGQSYSAPNIGVTTTTDLKIIDDFELFPNPASQEVNIQLPDLVFAPTHVLIYNNLSQLMYKKQTDQSLLRVDISNRQFTNGIYTVIIEQDGLITSKRLMIIK